MSVLLTIRDPSLLQALQNSGVGVMPTDTIYGLVASARDKDAVARLYALKGREHKPGTIVAASPEQLIELGLDAKVVGAVAHLWPNPISIVLPAPSTLDYLDQEVGSLAVRVPKDKTLVDLLTTVGPLVTTSANVPGEEPAGNPAEAQAYFGDQVDFYVDGDERGDRPPSTVVRLEADGSLTLLRAGAVTLNDKGENVEGDNR